MTDPERKIMMHALGLDSRAALLGRGHDYRNRFSTSADTDAYPHCESLVASGWMTKRPSNNLSSDISIYSVTVAGKTALKIEMGLA